MSACRPSPPPMTDRQLRWAARLSSVAFETWNKEPKMPDKEPKDPSAILIPFGKHKGKTVAELIATDQPYADWITTQGWVSERFAELHAAILSRGAGADDTPEHNALQGRFLDDDFRHTTLRLAVPGQLKTASEHATEGALRGIDHDIKQQDETLYALRSWRSHEKGAKERVAEVETKLRQTKAKIEPTKRQIPEISSHVRFEVAGVDVVIDWVFTVYGMRCGGSYSTGLELKPSIGDDYPSVMRQMRRTECAVLMVGQYTGRGVSEPQMRAMFEASGIRVVFVQEIEEAMRRT